METKKTSLENFIHIKKTVHLTEVLKRDKVF